MLSPILVHRVRPGRTFRFPESSGHRVPGGEAPQLPDRESFRLRTAAPFRLPRFLESVAQSRPDENEHKPTRLQDLARARFCRSPGFPLRLDRDVSPAPAPKQGSWSGRYGVLPRKRLELPRYRETNPLNLAQLPAVIRLFRHA